jgi:hypothetical protein
VSDTQASSDTPLSDLIAAISASRSSESYAQFLEAFRKSQVCVRAEGVPAGTVGRFVSTPECPVAVAKTVHAGGRPMVLAFADPEAFAARFGERFNAMMAGDALLATVLRNPDCAGVLVDSALAEVSVVITRATVQRLVRPGSSRPAAKPWWRFW